MTTLFRFRRSLGKTRDPYRRRVKNRLRDNPNDPEALFARAVYLALDGKADKALEVVNELAKVDVDFPDLWRFRAKLYERLGNAELASRCAARERSRKQAVLA